MTTGSCNSNKDENAYEDPCCAFPVAKVFKENRLTREERACVTSKCPGDSHPKKSTVYFASIFNKETGKYDAYKFLKDKEIKDRATQTLPCGGPDFGTPQRSGDNQEKCVCTCEGGYMGRYEKQGGLKDCDMNTRAVIRFDSDCIEMEDHYMIGCHDIATTICKPYSMTWRYECVRTCMAARGQSCIEETYQRFCSHDPECPAMCNEMISSYCKERVVKMVEPELEEEDVEDVSGLGALFGDMDEDY